MTTANSLPHTVEATLKAAGFSLPAPARPAGAYVPTLKWERQLFVSGQLSFDGTGALLTGRLGEQLALADGVRAAQYAALGALAQIKAALGSLDLVERVLKVGGFVQTTPSFTDIPAVVNGASHLLQLAFGDAGKHTRFAVGAAALPAGAAVEVEVLVAFSASPPPKPLKPL